jgi:dolichyl-phosphate-mannose-protein mannosyltransferase
VSRGAAVPRRTAAGVLHVASRHWGLLLLLVLGAAVRAAVVYAYEPAFFFPDSVAYLDIADTGVAQIVRPWGYSGFLAILGAVLPLRAVIAVQHGIGMLSAVLVYVLLQHRRVRRSVSCLAVVPLTLDAYLVQIEHYVMAESLYILLLVGALVLLLWRERPPWWATGCAGILLGSGAVTRTVGVVVAGVAGVYLLVQLFRRVVSVPALGAAALGIAAVLVPYVLWFQSHTGTYAITDFTGHFLYGRVSTFADCDRVDVPPRLRGLCPTRPPETRPPSDFYVWDAASPANSGRYSEEDLEEFSTIVLRGQPLDFVSSTVAKTLRYFAPDRSPERLDSCPGWWEFPEAGAAETTCPAVLTPPWSTLETPPSRLRAGPADALEDYQDWVHTPGPVLGLLAVAGLSGLVHLRRRPVVRDALDGALCVTIGLAVVAVPSATSVFDTRYGLPLLAVLPLGAALASRHWLSARQVDEPAVEPDPPATPSLRPAREPGRA